MKIRMKHSKILSLALGMMAMTVSNAWATTVRLDTVMGPIDIELFDDIAPNTCG